MTKQELEESLKRAKTAYSMYPDADNKQIVEHYEKKLKEVQPVYLGKMEMTNAEYHAAPGISSSNLRYLEESVLHLENKNLFNISTDSMEFGTLVHAMTLEPDSVEKEYAIAPKYDGRTKEGKAIKDEFVKNNVGKIVVSQEDFDMASVMANNIKVIAGNLLKNGEPESSFFAEDNGLLLKCRPDYYIPKLGLIIDVKTIADISEFGIKKSIANYRYDRSAAYYPKVLNLLGHEAERFIFIFVESAPPHMVKVREIHLDAMELAKNEVEFLLDKYRNYKITGKADLYKTIIPFEVRT